MMGTMGAKKAALDSTKNVQFKGDYARYHLVSSALRSVDLNWLRTLCADNPPR